MTSTDETNWSRWAARRIREVHGDGDTPLVRFSIPSRTGVELVFKDESAHPSGSLKHRLAASLLIYGVCNGEIGPTSTLVDASSGSTAVSEAYFARELGLPFIAVVPRNTSPSKLALIHKMGGAVELVDDASRVGAVAEALGQQPGHVFLDQFSNAGIRTNWRSSNLPSALFSQLREHGYGNPDWIVLGAGTGGTSATTAKYIRYEDLSTKVAIADPEGSAYYRSWLEQDRTQLGRPSRIEGIGRQKVEGSFMPQLMDRVVPVLDVWSVAAMRVLRKSGIPAGPSTGTNLIASLQLAEEICAAGRHGLIASLICDRADRYGDTYDDDAWLAEQGIHLTDELEQLGEYLGGGRTPKSWLPLTTAK